MALDPGEVAAKVAALSASPRHVRSLCVLAHVDHGKTTLSDALIAHNGLMHPKMVGKLRFMDFREDEQDRGITMKSASISLLYTPRPRGDGGAGGAAAVDAGDDAYLVNLIDSPGHVDFCSEVSSAARLSDGALVLVDACEGVCTQTHAVLRQAWEEKITPALVINKVDRLISELRLTPMEAYERLKRVIAEANRVMSTFASVKFLSDADAFMAGGGDEEGDVAAEGDADAGADPSAAPPAAEEQDSFSFSPEKGNVAFASAVDGWAFRTDVFADIYAARLGCSAAALRRALWGDYYYQPKTKRIVGKKRALAEAAPGARLRPLFVQLALEPLWQLYAAADAETEAADATARAGDGASAAAQPQGKSLADMAKALGVADAVPKRDLAAADRRTALRAVLRAWLPLSDAVLQMVVDCLPDPVSAAAARVAYLLPEAELAAAAAAATDLEAAAAVQAGVAGMLACDAACAQTIAFVSKMFAVPPGALPPDATSAAAETEADGAPRERFLAFARVFAGTLRAGDTLRILPPGAPPGAPDAPTARVAGIYLMMGRALQPLASAPAGAVVALAGLDTAVLKCATLAGGGAAGAACFPPLRGMYLQAAPTVRVALEPRAAGDLPALLRGLALLNRADPSVEVAVAASGEVVLGVAGEVHLQRCLTDLRERFARVDVAASPPLVAFRESAAGEAWPAALAGLTREKEKERERERDRDRWAGAKEVRTANGWCTLRARAAPLPGVAARALDDAAGTLRACLVRDSDRAAATSAAASASAGDAPAPADAHAAVEARLQEAEAAAAEGGAGEPVEGAAAAAAAALRRAWALGPNRCGANILLVGERRGAGVCSAADADVAAAAAPPHTAPLGAPFAGVALGFAPAEAAGSGDGVTSHSSGNGDDPAAAALWADVAAGVVAGFQACCERGPLCDEPLWGCAFELCAELAPEALAAAAQPQQAPAQPGGGAPDAPFAGQVLDAARKALRAALEAAAPRLVEQHYLCVVTTAPEALGGTYAVLHRRRARVLRERMAEGSGAFSVAALLPVAASFALADDLRARTSGAAGAQLLLSHWERVTQDPRFVPTTAEELEEFGADGAGPNAARALVDAVRRRKGLPVEEKVVAFATKQRTQARKR